MTIRTTQADAEMITKAPANLMNHAWHILNTWEWPEGFPDPDDGCPSLDDWKILAKDGGSRRSQLMCLIEGRLGIRELLRFGNVELRKAMTSKEFDDWWDNLRGKNEKDHPI